MMKFKDILERGGLATVLVAAVLTSSCTTTNLSGNKTGWSDYASIAVKDYAAVGIVRVECEEVTRRGFLGIAFYHTGSKVTYDLLIDEARKLGADDVINVRIDRTDKSFHGIFDWLVGYTEKYTYSANALAIKYTQAAAGYFPRGNDAATGTGGQSEHRQPAIQLNLAEADTSSTTLERGEALPKGPLVQRSVATNE